MGGRVPHPVRRRPRLLPRVRSLAFELRASPCRDRRARRAPRVHADRQGRGRRAVRQARLPLALPQSPARDRAGSRRPRLHDRARRAPLDPRAAREPRPRGGRHRHPPGSWCRVGAASRRGGCPGRPETAAPPPHRPSPPGAPGHDGGLPRQPLQVHAAERQALRQEARAGTGRPARPAGLPRSGRSRSDPRGHRARRLADLSARPRRRARRHVGAARAARGRPPQRMVPHLRAVPRGPADRVLARIRLPRHLLHRDARVRPGLRRLPGRHASADAHDRGPAPTPRCRRSTTASATPSTSGASAARPRTSRT